METPAQRCARIVGALEDLAAQEAAAIETHDFAGALTVQDRAEPLVDFIVRDAHAGVCDGAITSRISAVQMLRARTSEKLAQEMARTRNELQRMQATKSRVAQVAPAYGRSRPAAGNWQAIG
jgi:hypothetical protein